MEIYVLIQVFLSNLCAYLRQFEINWVFKRFTRKTDIIIISYYNHDKNEHIFITSFDSINNNICNPNHVFAKKLSQF